MSLMKITVSIILFLLLAIPSFIVSAEKDIYSKLGIIKSVDLDTAPPFVLEDLNGKKRNLIDYSGKVILLNFWATWCGPCIEEMPSLEKLYNIFKDKGFVVLAVSIDQGGINVVKNFVKENNLTFPVLLDVNHEIWKKYNVTGIPASFLISHKGIIKGYGIGSREWDNDTATELVRTLISDKDA